MIKYVHSKAVCVAIPKAGAARVVLQWPQRRRNKNKASMSSIVRVQRATHAQGLGTVTSSLNNTKF